MRFLIPSFVLVGAGIGIGPAGFLRLNYAREANTGSICSMSMFARGRDSVRTLVLARPTSDTVAAGAGFAVATRWDSLRLRLPIFGQVMRVDSIAGRDAERLRKVFLTRGSPQIVVVPWGYNPGCGKDRWEGSARWTIPDSAGLFFLTLRPDSLWVGNRPTFDALYASVYTYAYGPLTTHPGVKPRNHWCPSNPPLPSLSAAELYSAYMALPGFGEAREPAERRWNEFLQSHADWIFRYPTSVIIPLRAPPKCS